MGWEPREHQQDRACPAHSRRLTMAGVGGTFGPGLLECGGNSGLAFPGTPPVPALGLPKGSWGLCIVWDLVSGHGLSFAPRGAGVNQTIEWVVSGFSVASGLHREAWVPAPPPPQAQAASLGSHCGGTEQSSQVKGGGEPQEEPGVHSVPKSPRRLRSGAQEGANFAH